ncbi:MAG: hypothetical protein Q8K23_00015 [Sulfuritalea sp.]|nr:hypothetical protein [Sulfuritalea sp.]
MARRNNGGAPKSAASIGTLMKRPFGSQRARSKNDVEMVVAAVFAAGRDNRLLII